MRAFVVRPFKTKEGIDFDRMHRELIAPVLKSAGITGSTTEVIARAGNIRTDVFEQLLLADVVIADISIHNANVYYELGVRHSLRPRTTILIRARKDEVPFDLKTDRYLEYDPDAPADAQPNLAEAVRQSLASKDADSPVFLLLPALQPTDVESFRPVPAEFTEAVISARRGEDLPMLAVLADEAADFEWGLAGLRLIARAQVALRGWPDARATCEAIRSRRSDDPEANLLLATIHDRLEDPAASMAALERITGGVLTPNQQAEALALKGRNLKNLWIADWRDRPPEDQQAVALRSAQLESARTAYDEAFLLDQNHWYSGINALALLFVVLALAAKQPDAFAKRFDDEDEAAAVLRRLERDRDELTAAVRRSLSAEAFRTRGRPYDVWADLTRADLRLLSSEDPGRVAAAYEQARARMAAEGGTGFPGESAAQQIRLYLALGLFTDKARAALSALGVSEHPPAAKPRSRVVVFSGHRLDAPGRAGPRFPATPESIARATEMIRDAVQAEKALAGEGPIEGIAGGASGGDILFHEICLELGIPTTLMLAIPRDDYAAASVADAGPEWVERFRSLVERLDVKLLSQSKELPGWLAERGDYSIWQRNNRWTLHTAMSRSEVDCSLIVLWDGKGGDGPGGTEDMVNLARSRGVRLVHLSAAELTAP